MPDFVLTLEDFSSAEWEQVIVSCNNKTCESYVTAFLHKAKETESLEGVKAQQVFSLLGAVASPRLVAESRDEPFAPMWETGNQRSIVPDDLTEGHLQSLSEVAPHVSDAELRARVADILWVRKRDPQMAVLAITSYLQSATVLEDGTHWPPCAQRIRRALNLAASLGKKGEQFSKVIEHIERVLERQHGEDPLYLCATLMEMLQEHRQGDAAKYATWAEEIVRGAEAARDWHRARKYLEVKARWHTLAGNVDAQRETLLLAAETHVKEADNNTHIAAAFHVKAAIEALRRIVGTKERREELHKSLLDHQKESLGEMKRLEFEMDMTPFAREAANRVKGKRVREALLMLALMCRSPKISDLRAQVHELVNEFPLQHLVSSETVNADGKTVARHASMLSADAEERERATRQEMWRQAIWHQETSVVLAIEPARLQIILEHDVRLCDFLPIVENNPFVPPGRESVYARGLLSGMKGDFLLAIHLLIPQVENSLRYVLGRQGILTSGLVDGVQEEYDLNKILTLPELTNVFGEDVVFDMQGLFVERYGSNLRNRMAHGLMEPDAFFSPQAVYLWWLVLRLCCLPTIKVKDNDDATQEE